MENNKAHMSDLMNPQMVEKLHQMALQAEFDKAMKQRKKQEKKAFFTAKALKGRAK